MKFVLNDNETSGFSDTRDRILSISHLVLKEDLTVESAYHKFIYHSGLVISKDATDVHHLDADFLYRNGSSPEDVFDELYPTYQRANFMAHNVEFDSRFVRNEFGRAGYDVMFDMQICTMKSTVEACALPRKKGTGFKFPKLAEACQHYRVTDDMVKMIYNQYFSEFNIPLNLTFHSSAYDVAATYAMLLMGGWASVRKLNNFD